MGLAGKNVVVIGGTGSVGRILATVAEAEGARLLVTGRSQDSLDRLQKELPGVKTLSLDATGEEAPAQVFDALPPDVLIICAGAIPHMAPVQAQSWTEFSRNWDCDVKISFTFCKAAINLPLSSGAKIVLISSGAAIGGSPLSGSYAGAKRMQMLLARYCQKESDRLGLGLSFMAIAPMRIMPDTVLGKAAVDSYASYQGISSAEFVRAIGKSQTPRDVAHALINAASAADTKGGSIIGVSSAGLEPIP